MTTQDPYTPDAGSYCPKEDADACIKRYMDYWHEHEKNTNRVRAAFWGSDFIKNVLNTKGAVGLRAYMGFEKDVNGKPGQSKIFLIPTDKDGKDIYMEEANHTHHIAAQAEAVSGGSSAGDTSVTCPVYCGK